MPEYKKRETAHKLRIGEILSGIPIVEDIPQEVPNPNEVKENPESQSNLANPASQANQQAQTTSIAPTKTTRERFRFLEVGDKRVIRVNVIANIIEKYQAEGEKKYASITVDDSTGQIRLKAFGEDTEKLNDLNQGDTITIIGVLRTYTGDIYILPEIVKKVDPRYLLIRKLEIEKKSGMRPSTSSQSSSSTNNDPNQTNMTKSLKDEILELIKAESQTNSSGASTEDLILKIKSSSPEAINSEVIKLIEDGIVYEPRPGRVRYLG